MSDPFLSNVDQADCSGVRAAKIQRWLKQACINAGASIASSDPLLSDVNTGDSEGMKAAKIQRWTKLLANSVGATATNPMTSLGDTVYGSESGAFTALAGNTTTTREFLRQTGTGTSSAAPSWDTVTKSDVGLPLVENTALSTWAGSSNLTNLGTVATGVWQGTPIASAYLASVLGKKVVNIVFEGDSLTDPTAPYPGVGNDWPTKIVSLYDYWGASTNYNYARPSNHISDLVARYAASVQPKKPVSVGDRSLLSVWIGTNDLGGGDSAATVYANLKSYWAQARSDGFTIIAWCIMFNGNHTNGQNTQRLALNDLIRSDQSLYDFLIDPEYLTLTRPDGVHPNAAGNLIIAKAVNDIVCGQSGSLLAAAVRNECGYPVSGPCKGGTIKLRQYFINPSIAGYTFNSFVTDGVQMQDDATLPSWDFLLDCRASGDSFRLRSMAAGGTSMVGRLNLSGTGIIQLPGYTTVGLATFDSSGTISSSTFGNSVAINEGILDTVQDIRTSANPQFARVGAGIAASATSPFKGKTAQTSTTLMDNVLLDLSSNAAGADATIHLSDGTAYNAYISLNGGDIIITDNTFGPRFVIKNNGPIVYNGVPTSPAGLQSGAIWKDTTGGLNILKIV